MLTCLSWPEHRGPVLGWLYSTPTHHFSWKIYLSAISPSVVTPLAANSGCWYPPPPFTPWYIQVSRPPDTWLQPVSYGEVWPLMLAGGAECNTCQKAKITTQPSAPVQNIPVPARRFTHMHADLVGPLPVSSSSHSHLMTIIDQSTLGVSFTAILNYSLCGHVCGQMDGLIWCASLQHNRQRCTVHLSHLGHPLPVARHSAHHNNSLFPSIQQHFRMFSLTTERQLEGPPCFNRVAVTLSMGSAGPLLSIQVENLPRPPPAGLHTWKLAPLPSTSAAGPLQSLMTPTSFLSSADAPGLPFWPLYYGPYKVVAGTLKVFELEIGSHKETVSVDWLNPSLSSELTIASPPHRGRPPLQPSESQPLASILGGPL